MRSTRRDFLKQAALVGAGVCVGGRSGWSADRSPNEMLNVAVIGVAGRGASNLAAVAELTNVVALCDIDDPRLGKAAEQHPRAKTYNDFRKLLEQRDIDAVLVATPDHTHAVAAVAAMKLGKHVYCEKPLAHSVWEVRRMTETAAEQKVATQMGNQRHAAPELRQVVELLRAGVIGPVREVITWSNKVFSGGDRPTDTPPVPENVHWDLWLGPAPERPYHPTYHPRLWRGWWDFGSGNYGDMACHILDAPYWGLNLRWPTKVSAEGPPVHPESAPKWLIVNYEFPARDGQPPVKFTWYDGEKAPPRHILEGVTLPGQGALMIGEKGKILFPHGNEPARLLPEADFAGFKLPEPTLPRPQSHHAEWIHACKTGEPAASNFDYAGPLAETVMAGVVAYRVGQQLDWDGEAMRATNCPEADRLIRPRFREGWEV